MLKNQPLELFSKHQLRFWKTPEILYNCLNELFKFNFDPCPYPRDPNFNSLNINWKQSNYVNPPFFKEPPTYSGPAEFISKAIEQNDLKNSSVIILPTRHYVNKLLFNGARIFPIPRPKFLEVDTNEIQRKPGPHSLFVLGYSDISSTDIRKHISSCK